MPLMAFFSPLLLSLAILVIFPLATLFFTFSHLSDSLNLLLPRHANHAPIPPNPPIHTRPSNAIRPISVPQHQHCPLKKKQKSNPSSILPSIPPSSPLFLHPPQTANTTAAKATATSTQRAY
uniref:Uncharacterized protein n=1 Tax=Leishmania guyanensis TaxID=5670 RepID=A0A1E1IYX1_LEIGU|nr:Hypothetical protein BN36_2231130 [Leishmania guyanensis]